MSRSRRLGSGLRAAGAVTSVVVACVLPGAARADVPLPHEGGVQHQGPVHPFTGQHGARTKDLALAPVDARLWLVAPSPKGPWTMRIDNVSESPIRIPADARLLRFEITPAATEADKKPKKVKCEAPPGLRPKSFPEERALVLKPGESYIESFDPHLFCFGKNASALEGGGLVRTRFGWDPPPSWDRRPLKAPFAVANLDLPADGRSQRELSAAPIVLSHGIHERASYDGEPPTMGPDAPPKKHGHHGPHGKHHGPPGPKEKVDLRDYNVPRLEVDTAKFADATSASTISVVVRAKNDGRREMLAALRPRMLSFEVTGPLLLDWQRPDRETQCLPSQQKAAIPREMFHSFAPDESVSFSVLVAELCPKGTFLRPGIYRVRPTMHATESGAELGLAAHTETSRSLHETLVRVHTGRLPYHLMPPVAIETSSLASGFSRRRPLRPPPSPDDEVESAWGGGGRRGRPAAGGGGFPGSAPPSPPPASFEPVPSAPDPGAAPPPDAPELPPPPPPGGDQ